MLISRSVIQCHKILAGTRRNRSRPEHDTWAAVSDLFTPRMTSSWAALAAAVSPADEAVWAAAAIAAGMVEVWTASGAAVHTHAEAGRTATLVRANVAGADAFPILADEVTLRAGRRFGTDVATESAVVAIGLQIDALVSRGLHANLPRCFAGLALAIEAKLFFSADTTPIFLLA